MKEVVLEVDNCLKFRNVILDSQCPINTDIQTVIEYYIKGNKKKAGEILFENNPLSILCSVVCPNEEQCKGNCIKGIKDKPVGFHELEYEISLEYLKSLKGNKPISNGQSVGIIGAGIREIVIGIELAKKGYSVSIFEEKYNINEIFEEFIKKFSLEKKVLNYYEVYLENIGINIIQSKEEEECLTLDKLFLKGYKAIFIGTEISNEKEISRTDEGVIITNKYGHTSREGVFAREYNANRGEVIVEMVLEAKELAKSIDNYCNSLG